MSQTPTVKAKVVRVTERQRFRECRRAWRYEYVENLEPINREPGARDLGTALHAALAAFYTGFTKPGRAALHRPDFGLRQQRLWSAWATAQITCSAEDSALGASMLDHYLKHWGEDIAIQPFRVEQTFYAKIPHTNLWLRGTPDIVAYYDDRGTWVIDNKGFRQPMLDKEAQHDDQMTAYMWLLGKNGIRVRNGLYNMLRKAPLGVPQLLKNGQLSRDKRLRTTQAVYREAVIAAGLNMADYEEHIESIPDGDFFPRVEVYRTDTEIANFETYLIAQAKEMYSKRTVLYPTDSPQKVCRFCNFSGLCRTESQGCDTEIVKRMEYRQRQDSILNLDITEGDDD